MELERAQPAIDLTRYHFVRHLGDMTVYGTWLFNDDQEDSEPCLVVIPRYRTTGFRPIVVALSAAYKYNSPQYLAQVAGLFAEGLGFERDLTTARKVATLIHDNLLDLLNMPLDPSVGVVVGEASVNIDGRKRNIEVLDYEQKRG